MKLFKEANATFADVNIKSFYAMRTNTLGIAKSNLLKSLFFVISFSFFFVGVYANKPGTSTKVNERQIENAEKQQVRFQEKLQEADSLIALGDTLMNKTSLEIRQATIEMRERSREYNAQKKELDKVLNESVRTEATQLRLAIRKLDEQYRDDLKAYDDYMRRVIRESEVGTFSFDRGREIRKEAERGIKEAERELAKLRQDMGETVSGDDSVASN